MAFAMIDFDEEDHKKISIGNLIMIEELEKIKAEIMSIGNWREHYEMPIAYLSCLTIVEHHISELKGKTMPITKQTNLVIRHFPDRAKPCICLEQGNQAIVIGTLRNKECEELWNRFMQNCFLSREMSDLFQN